MKKLFILIVVAFASINIFAQQPDPQKGQPPFNPEKFQKMVEESLTKAACLTDDEAKAFFPLYNEMRAKQRDLGKQIYELKKNCKGDAKSCSETILKLKQLQVDIAQVEENYYKRILKVVPADKVFKVIKAEDDFHRRMVQRQRGDRRDGRKGRGHDHN